MDPPKDVGVEGGALGMSMTLAWLDSLKLCVRGPLTPVPRIEERPTTLGPEEGPALFQVGLCERS